ncbi:MAG: TIGR03915 family putative DNA repair protein [Agriterribacter sp.]
MIPMVYDGSFEGLLTAIFEVYEYKLKDPSIVKEGSAASLFGKTHIVHTSAEKAERVWTRLQEKLSRQAIGQVYCSFLSEIAGIEDYILRYAQYALKNKSAIENDYSNKDVLMLQQTSKKVHREKHRMEAFVRFQLTKDGLYYAMIQPDFNVLPLVVKHFRERYADQRWLIYDTRRKYGMYYDLTEVGAIEMDFSEATTDNSQLFSIHDEKEELYQTLWQQYFASVNIAARKNLKLHIKHMPKRYWKNLAEKKGKSH